MPLHLMNVRCTPGLDPKDGKWVPGTVTVSIHDAGTVHSQQLYFEAPRCDSREEARAAGIKAGEAWAIETYSED